MRYFRMVVLSAMLAALYLIQLNASLWHTFLLGG